MQHLANHPFPYFGLDVTRDLAAIKQKIEAKYTPMKKWENHTTEGSRYKEFTNFALLLVVPPTSSGKPGEYTIDAKKVDVIVEACLKIVESHFMGFVWPDNSIHVDVPARVVQWAKDVWKIDPSLTKPFIDDLVRKKGYKSSTVAPKRLPKAIQNLRAKCLDSAIELRWDLPPVDCESVIISRSNGMPQLSDRKHQFHGVSWTDHDVVPGEVYCYGLFSVVENNPGAMESVRVIARSTVKSFQAYAEGKKVVLTWDLPRNVQKIIVVRAATPLTTIVDEYGRLVMPPGATQLAEIGAEARYEDTKVSLGQTYHYAIAARHAADCYSPSESRSVSVSTAPSPPQGLKAKAAPGVIHLSWEPPANVDSPRFRIERSETAALASPDSNSTRLRPHGTTYDDRNVEPGTAYWYHVWTVNSDNVESLQPAVAGPELAYAEVTDLRVSVAEQQVQLSWSQPAKVVRIEVRRGIDQVPPVPTQPGVAIPGSALVPILQPGRLIDTNLVNERTYGYRVSCVFKRPDGTDMVTRGEAVLATPAIPPQAIGGIRLENTARGLVLRWHNPDKAQVVVLRSPRQPQLALNQCIPLPELDTNDPAQQLGTRVLGVLSEAVHDPVPDPETPFYLFFTVNRSQARLCGIGQYVEIANAGTREQDGHLHLTWSWPPSCQAIMLRPLKEGATDPAKVKGKRIDRQTTQRSGGVRMGLDKLANGKHRFHLQCIAPENDPTRLAGPGVTLDHLVNKTQHVTWYLRKTKKWLVATKTEVVVHPERDLEGVERFVLVGKINRWPENIHDGKILLEWEPEGGEQALDVPAVKTTDGSYYCRLFADPPEGITMVDPVVEECVL